MCLPSSVKQYSADTALVTSAYSLDKGANKQHKPNKAIVTYLQCCYSACDTSLFSGQRRQQKAWNQQSYYADATALMTSWFVLCLQLWKCRVYQAANLQYSALWYMHTMSQCPSNCKTWVCRKLLNITILISVGNSRDDCKYSNSLCCCLHSTAMTLPT